MRSDEIILPCPFCGSPRTRLKRRAEDYVVRCQSCGGIGPGDPLADSAVQRWNSRSALAASFGAPRRDAARTAEPA